MAAKDNFILDTSVIIKWFIKEENSDKALSYLKDFQNNKIRIIIPTLLFYELGNVLLNKKGTASMAQDVIHMLKNLHMGLKDVVIESFEKIYSNAQKYSLTFYDSTYVTLMKEKNCKFVTADKKLYQKIKNDFPLAQLI